MEQMLRECKAKYFTDAQNEKKRLKSLLITEMGDNANWRYSGSSSLYYFYDKNNTLCNLRITDDELATFMKDQFQMDLKKVYYPGSIIIANEDVSQRYGFLFHNLF